MNCDFKYSKEGRTENLDILICSRCNETAVCPKGRMGELKRPCKSSLDDDTQINNGPGTELTKIIARLGVEPIGGCSCDNLAVKMDSLGVSGCIEQRETLIKEMRENYAKYTWADVIRAAPNAIGLLGSVNPLDPVPGLINAAIANAAGRYLNKRNFAGFA